MLRLSNKGFADIRYDHLCGQRFYIDGQKMHRKLRVDRKGFFSRAAKSSFFDASTSEVLNSSAETGLAYFMKELWSKEPVKDSPKVDIDLGEPPQDMLDMLLRFEDPKFSFRCTWEKRDVHYQNSLGISKHRTDLTKILRMDYIDEHIHLRKFVYDPSLETVQKKIDSIRQVLLNLRKDRFEEAPSGPNDVILDPTLSAVLAHEVFGHVAERVQGIWDWKQCQRMAMSPALHVTDYASRPLIGVNHLFDDEGFSPRDIPIIQNGQFSEIIATAETAFRLNRSVYGRSRAQDFRYRPLSRMSNICIEPGSHALSELFTELQDGYYFMGALGGALTENMFQIQAQHGYRIANGKLKSYVRGALLYGLLERVLDKSSLFGQKVDWVPDGGCFAGGQFLDFSGRGGPPILMRGIHVA